MFSYLNEPLQTVNQSELNITLVVPKRRPTIQSNSYNRDGTPNSGPPTTKSSTNKVVASTENHPTRQKLAKLVKIGLRGRHHHINNIAAEKPPTVTLVKESVNELNRSNEIDSYGYTPHFDPMITGHSGTIIRPTTELAFHYPAEIFANSQATLVLPCGMKKNSPAIKPKKADNRILYLNGIPKGLNLSYILSLIRSGPLERIIIPATQYPCFSSSMDSKVPTDFEVNLTVNEDQQYYCIELRFMKSENAHDFYNLTREKKFFISDFYFWPEWASHANRAISPFVKDNMVKKGARRGLFLTPRQDIPPNYKMACTWNLNHIHHDFARFGTLVSVIPREDLTSNGTVLKLAIDYTDVRFAISAKYSFDNAKYWLEYRIHWSLDYCEDNGETFS
ncbi:hypothetical protein NADFUDRAFT_48808 [Nadsonia fulvescens var. elongata DSM 6958]|uniref:Uncharacterized protein n=1 Tax=Nadsonia fulvescens var. elongata DSM 6958 TaxID=857566 RepID=A0A1E3PRV1_9ASCO|nr:hypothetical protein NADFUDRAFT_48808 [Nadsonia fulvescens var. elongata DSM 6958]